MILGEGSRPRRLAAYFFYDEAGVVDDYVVHMLEAIGEHVESTLVVCNGVLTAQGRAKLESVAGVRVLVRPNEGFDVWAYKAAIDAVGWDELATYDEFVMLNFTIMGPVHPLATMFAEMDARDLDFWGITVHNGAPFDPWGLMPDGRIPLHIQSHFIAVRQPMLRSPEFQRYWDEMFPITSYIDAVGKHEALFTQRFADMGFAWDVYVDTSDMRGHLFYPLFNEPVELVARRGCPIFKRKLFFAGSGAFLDENSKRPARELLDYLRETKAFPEHLLVPHLLRSSHQFDLGASLNLVEVIDPGRAQAATLQQSVAAVLCASTFVQFRDHFDVLRNVPTSRVVAVVPDDAGLRAAVETLGHARGLDVEIVTGDTWLLGAADLMDVDILCVLEASGEVSTFPHSNSDAFARDTRAAMAASPEYVQNVLRLFADDPYVGMATPPPPIHSRYFGDIGNEWAGTFGVVSGWSAELGLEVPLSPLKPPLAPVGGSFWCRPSAITPLVENAAALHNPLGVDRHTWRLALRQFTAIAVQARGYVPTWVMPDFLAANYVTSLMHYVREVASRLGAGAGDTFSGMLHRLHVTERLTASLPHNSHVTFAVYPDTGGGFSEASVMRIPYSSPALGGRDVRAVFDVPEGTRAVRFDPLEGMVCVCKDARVEADVPLDLRPVNGVRIGRADVFPSLDPQYEIVGELDRARRVTVVFGEMHAVGTEPGVLAELVSAVAETAGSGERPQRPRRGMRAR